MTWYALATYKAGSNNKTALVLCEGEDPRLYDLDGVVKAVKANGEQPSWTGTGLMALIEGWADNESSVSDLAVAAADLGFFDPAGALPPRLHHPSSRKTPTKLGNKTESPQRAPELTPVSTSPKQPHLQ